MWCVCFGANLPELTHFSSSYNGFPVLKLELFERPEGFLKAPNNKLSSKASSPNNPSPMFRRTKQVLAAVPGVWGAVEGDSLSLAVKPDWQWLQPDGSSLIWWLQGHCAVLWVCFLPAPYPTRAPVQVIACCAVPVPSPFFTLFSMNFPHPLLDCFSLPRALRNSNFQSNRDFKKCKVLAVEYCAVAGFGITHCFHVLSHFIISLMLLLQFP